MPQLIVSHLSVRYGGSPANGHAGAGRPGVGENVVVRDLSFALETGEIGCLVGASGCGKTTVLRAIAGFLSPSAGIIELDGRRIAGAGAGLPPEQRRVGMVFQDFALFPHLDVRSNIGFGIREGPGRLPAAERERRIDDMLSLVRLEGLGDRFAHQLSGGQQQRVAIARALAPRPALLLLDEPFSSLDTELRDALSVELRSILKETGTTTIFVTHDQREAFAVSDWIGVMHQGRLEQWGRAYDLYHQPRTRYVAGFIGEGEFLPGQVIGVCAGGHDAASTGDEMLSGTMVRTEVGVLACHHPECEATAAAMTAAAAAQAAVPDLQGEVEVLLRPDDILHEDDAPLRAKIVRKAFRGADFLYTLELASGRRLLSLVPSHHDHAVGEAIGIRLAADHVVVFPRAAVPVAGPAPAATPVMMPGDAGRAAA